MEVALLVASVVTVELLLVLLVVLGAAVCAANDVTLLRGNVVRACRCPRKMKLRPLADRLESSCLIHLRAD